MKKQKIIYKSKKHPLTIPGGHRRGYGFCVVIMRKLCAYIKNTRPQHEFISSDLQNHTYLHTYTHTHPK